MITEAGGLIGNFTGEADFLYQREVVAGNPKVYGQLVQMLAVHPCGRACRCGRRAHAGAGRGLNASYDAGSRPRSDRSSERSAAGRGAPAEKGSGADPCRGRFKQERRTGSALRGPGRGCRALYQSRSPSGTAMRANTARISV